MNTLTTFFYLQKLYGAAGACSETAAIPSVNKLGQLALIDGGLCRPRSTATAKVELGSSRISPQQQQQQ
jgi:hypothetical protein